MFDALNVLITPFLVSLMVSTGIGLIIGLEREFRQTTEKDHFAGIRTFPLVAILGCIITFIAKTITLWLLASGFLAFALFVSIAYYIRSSSGHAGITTEISLFITFILGAMTSLQLIKEALAITVITTTLLSLKGQFRSFILKITEDELFAFIKFIILCMLLFPFLPDVDYGPDGILNPRAIGLVVVIVSSLSFIAYLLIKFTDANKGILLTAFFGGLFSSTAVTWTFSSRSRKSDASHTTLYAEGIILASSIMFLRVALIALIFSKEFFMILVIPCLLMSLTGLSFVLALVRNKNSATVSLPVELGNPVNILNALGFGLLYVGIALLVFYANKYFGSSGLIFSGLISGLADVDAITINMSKLAVNTYELDLSVLVIIAASISNTVIKIAIALFKGRAEIRKKVSLALGAVIATGILYILIRIL